MTALGKGLAQGVCPGASAPLSPTHRAVLTRLLLQLPASRSFYPVQRAGAHSGFCHLITGIQQCPRTAGHAVCSPRHKDQGCPGMEQDETPGPGSIPGQQDKYHGVHCLTQLWEWECQQLPRGSGYSCAQQGSRDGTESSLESGDRGLPKMPNQGWFFSPQVLQNPCLSLNTEETVTSGSRNQTLGNMCPSLKERSINKRRTQKEKIQEESMAGTSPAEAKRGGQRNIFPTGTTTQLLYDCCNIPVLKCHH